MELNHVFMVAFRLRSFSLTKHNFTHSAVPLCSLCLKLVDMKVITRGVWWYDIHDVTLNPAMTHWFLV